MTDRPTEHETMWALVREAKFVTDPEFKPEPPRAKTVREGRLTRQLGVEPVYGLDAGFGGRLPERPEGAFEWPPFEFRPTKVQQRQIEKGTWK
jgi:hypothetical protein